MSSYRLDRTSEDIMRELTAILRHVKDPRVSGMLSIVRVEVTNDMSYAKVYISAMEGLEAAVGERNIYTMYRSAAQQVTELAAAKIRLFQGASEAVRIA